MYMYTHVHVCRQTHLVTYVYYTYMYSGTPYNGLEDTSPFWYFIMLKDISIKRKSSLVPKVSIKEGFHCIMCL